jgi:hypothetical protein
VILLVPRLGLAQEEQARAPDSLIGLVSWVEGEVSLRGSTRDGIWQGELMAVYAGQEILSAQGRAEIMLSQDSLLRLDEFSEITLLTAGPPGASIRLNTGAIILNLLRESEEEIVVRQGQNEVRLRRKGVYRIDARESEPARLRVFRGQAIARVEGREVELKAPQWVQLAEALSASAFDRARLDDFDDWNKKRNLLVAQRQKKGVQPDFEGAAAAIVATILNSSRVNPRPPAR